MYQNKPFVALGSLLWSPWIFQPYYLYPNIFDPTKLFIGSGIGLNFSPEIIRQWDSKWIKFQCLNNFKFNRHIDSTDAVSIDSYGFCYGSQKEYACVIHLRVLNGSEFYIYFVIAWSRIASLRRVLTIPSIELLGDALLSNVLKYTYYIPSNQRIQNYAGL